MQGQGRDAMMYGYGKSDSSIVTEKLPNKASKTVADAMEEGNWPSGIRLRVTCPGRRAGAVCHAHSTGYARQRLRIRRCILPNALSSKRQNLRHEPNEVVPHVRICAGGGRATGIPTAIRDTQARQTFVFSAADYGTCMRRPSERRNRSPVHGQTASRFP